MNSDPMDEADLERLEQTIFKARSYVVASEDLRPRLVEKAKDRKHQQRIARRWSVGILACAVVWSVSVPIYHSLSPLRDQVTAPFPDEVERMALERSRRTKRVGSWGMVEAFTQIRILPRAYETSDQSVDTKSRNSKSSNLNSSNQNSANGKDLESK